MKKGIAWGIVILIVVIILGGFMCFKAKETTKNKTLSINNSLLVSKEFINVYKGTFDVTNLEREGLSDTVKSKVVQFNDYMQGRDTAYFNVDKYFLNYSADPMYGTYKESGSTEVINPNGLPDDERIIQKEGVSYIPLKDIKFNADGLEVINYKGIEMWLLEIPEDMKSYSVITSDPKYIYTFQTYRYIKSKNGDSIEVLYKPYSDGNSILFRYKVEKGILSDVEVLGAPFYES